MFKYRCAQQNAGASSFPDAVVEIGYLQGRLFELNRSFTEHMHQCQSRSEATESRFREDSILIADLQSRLNACFEQLTNIGNEFHAQRDRADALQMHLQSIFESRSWRLTKPIRVIFSRFRRRLNV
jgi:hypothetical protein